MVPLLCVCLEYPPGGRGDGVDVRLSLCWLAGVSRCAWRAGSYQSLAGSGSHRAVGSGADVCHCSQVSGQNVEKFQEAYSKLMLSSMDSLKRVKKAKTARMAQ